MTLKRKIIFSLITMLVLLVIFNLDLINYGLSQAKGQIKIIREARPIDEVLKDPSFPDSLKINLQLVNEIKSFAFDSLGINFSKNYSTVYDQKGKELMFVVTACQPFMLEPKEWSFPLIGSFSYKGFFDLEKAQLLERQLRDEGLDTNIRTAGGWSTLGWFEDPILSNMLDDTEAGFAELLFHELTHGTLFVKDSLRFNENLATFIGIKGTERYLTMKYGENNKYLVDYQNLWKDRNMVSEHVLAGAKHLDSIYNALDAGLPVNKKLHIKQNAIDHIINSIDTLNLSDKQRYTNYYKQIKPNNTLFMSYLRYRGDFAVLDKELETKFNGNIKMMLEEYKQTYPSL